MSCEYCGKEEWLPFTCPYCGKRFCAEHRLPENHKCSELWMAKPPLQGFKLRPAQSYRTKTFSFIRTIRTLKFSFTEVIHLTIGTLLVILIGLSLMKFAGPWFILLPSITLFASAFILHELAHKFVAQSYGLWAEFRLNTFGVIITLISILPFFFKIIAPGAVIISGYATTKAIGKSAISGPLINIILALILILFLPMVPIPFHIILRNGAYINTLIAFLNLLPFGMFDGYKVISWDKRVWVFVFLTSIILLFVIYIKL